LLLPILRRVGSRVETAWRLSLRKAVVE
jgi:hypothetical protein